MNQPVVLKEGAYTSEQLLAFKSENKIWKTVDVLATQLEELFEILHPESNLLSPDDRSVALNDFLAQHPADELHGNWIYLPWSGTLLHTVNEAELTQLRTNRNQNLITSTEQQVLNDSIVGVLGMSVGNSIATALVYSGISAHIKLADFDELSTANLNRLRAGLHQIGLPKTDIAAQQIYELNPYATIDLFPLGVKESNLDLFLNDPRLSIVFDEIDDFVMKIKIRIRARELGIPVIMLTSLGDSIVIDVERYDLDDKLPLFNGLIGDTPEEILNAEIGEKEKIKYAIDLIGSDYIPTRALESLFEINRSLVGRPQLASTITVDGGIASYLVRRLLLKGSVPSGRYYLSFATAIGIEDDTKTENHQVIIDRLNQMLGRG